MQFIESGVRTAQRSLNRHILSILNLAGKYVRIWYPNQPKTCRNCGVDDHLVKDCNSARCFNCEKPGHRTEKCGEEPKCTVCKSEEHRLAECPFVLYSANVDSSPKEQTEEEKQQDKEKYKQRLEQEKKKRKATEKQQAEMQKAAKEKVKDKSGDKGDKDKNKGNDNGKDNGRDKGEDKGDDDKHSCEKRPRRSRSSDRREKCDDEREKGDCQEFEAWKDQQRRERDCEDRRDDRYREHSRRDFLWDCSTRREDDYYSDDGDGWTHDHPY